MENKTPLIVTGHGRSGTHWLTHVLGHFFDARHEPSDSNGADVVVDCRLHRQVEQIRDSHRVIHLVRDGREVVRSTHEFYKGRMSFEDACESWAAAVEACKGLEAVRLEDLIQKQADSHGYRLSHWREWPDSFTEAFWKICGEGMERHGYTREGR